MPRSCTVAKCNKANFKSGYCAAHFKSFHAVAQEYQAGVNDAKTGLDDMVLISKVDAKSIFENLKKRHKNDVIYTYIGNVVISMNPFKRIPIYGDEYVEKYNRKQIHENPPHVFALAEASYRDMLQEEDDQCVIISGESGAGKTEAAKQIMAYIAAVSPGDGNAAQVKDMILESNPLLEAFGNAKTLRNNNSSRFGKYFNIRFDMAGVPRGGLITNYLLEKSRIVYHGKGERGFHIFYQLLKAAPSAARKALRLGKDPEAFKFAAGGDMDVANMDDVEEFKATQHAMKAVGLRSKDQSAVFGAVACVLHLGQIKFREKKKGGVEVKGAANAADLLGVEEAALVQALSSRHIVTAREEYDVPNNELQASATRDAVAKELYSRMFDWLVRRVNTAIKTDGDQPLGIGVLDIYGFEIFKQNGFEQFCINYVNEKLQQIFIELTLRSEQDEYVREGIEWKPIKFFNNKVVCDLIEGKRPPGIFLVLDDVCATMHAQAKGLDEALCGKLGGAHGGHKHFRGGKATTFQIKHFAGDVWYDAGDFAEKNKDTLFKDVVLMLQTSKNKLVQTLFPDKVDLKSKKKPKTMGYKIKTQSNQLVDALMRCTPHYVRCLKSNDKKRGDYMEDDRVKHQIQFLGLLENVKVRRAGFASRMEFHKFVRRFALLSSKTADGNFDGSDKSAVKEILRSVAKKLKLNKEEVQLGKTMVFIKSPESLFAMQSLKQDKLGEYAAVIQRCYRRYRSNKKYVALRRAANKRFKDKQRRRESYYRPYQGRYFKVKSRPGVVRVLEAAEDDSRVTFADSVQRVVQRGARKSKKELELETDRLTLVMTKQALYLIQEPTSSSKGKKRRKDSGGSEEAVLRRRIPIDAITGVSVSELADNYLCVHVRPQKRPLQPVEWVQNKESKQCSTCGDGFGLFNRRHHCRLCAQLFCKECTQQSQPMPDYGFFEPVRVCGSCFGMESRDPLGDQLLRTGKKTELITLMLDLRSQGEDELGVSIVDKIKYKCFADLAEGVVGKPSKGGKQGQGTGKQAQSVNAEVVFKEKGKREKANLVNSTKLSVSVPEGLSSDFVAAREKAAEKRRQAYAQKQRKEAEKRKRREAVKAKEREAQRREKLMEKKRRKAEMLKKREAEKSGGGGGGGGGAAPGPCRECGCSDYLKNVFKRGHCNNCFHKH